MQNIRKEYQLGIIGRDTLQHELQSRLARMRRRQDPNQRIGQRIQEEGTFLALDDLSLEIHRGERVGVIGANGAGKSTMFKLLSRITAPTDGEIRIKGRISSMLEIGTGFHGELTGRENIYLKGAILGMKRKEIEQKLEDIISFSECETFIDTPVKRYSSGMYVKLAFAVAAHLNSDILLMDEVLAVGDMKFQKKCLEKMAELAENDQKTILYVSHNMETIRTLCDRCLVLDKGKLMYDGSVEEGIAAYMGAVGQLKSYYTYEEIGKSRKVTGRIRFRWLELVKPEVAAKEGLKMRIGYYAEEGIEDLHIRLTVHGTDQQAAGTSISKSLGRQQRGEWEVALAFDTTSLAEGRYTMELAAVEPVKSDAQKRHGWLESAFAFEITEDIFDQYSKKWPQKAWGCNIYPDAEVLEYGMSIKRNGTGDSGSAEK